jgi:hypothetical protein
VNLVACKLCGKQITFARMNVAASGLAPEWKKIPLDPVPPTYFVWEASSGETECRRANGEGNRNPTLVSHFATCRGLDKKPAVTVDKPAGD